MRPLMPATLANVQPASPAKAPARSLRANTWWQRDVDRGGTDDRLSRFIWTLSLPIAQIKRGIWS